MTNRSAEGHPPKAPVSHRRLLRMYSPVVIALLAIGAIYMLLSQQLAPGPRGLILGVILVLVIALVVTIHAELPHLTRAAGLLLLGVVTLAEALSAGALMVSALAPVFQVGDVPQLSTLAMLRDSGLIWLINALTFSLWYWELDGGGPGRRHAKGYTSHDYIFPQSALVQSTSPDWMPHYVDYLFLAFNTNTAFSPTDTSVLSVRAKLLMMLQSLISLIVLTITLGRAINAL